VQHTHWLNLETKVTTLLPPFANKIIDAIHAKWLKPMTLQKQIVIYLWISLMWQFPPTINFFPLIYPIKELSDIILLLTISLLSLLFLVVCDMLETIKKTKIICPPISQQATDDKPKYFEYFGVFWDKDNNARCPKCEFTLIENNDHAVPYSTALCNKCEWEEELKDETGRTFKLLEAKNIVKTFKTGKNLNEKQSLNLRHGLKWDEQLNPFCPSCEKPLSTKVKNTLFCSSCDKKFPLRHPETQYAVSLIEMQEFIKSK